MDYQPFNQPPPQLGNQYDDDSVLRSYLKRVLPEEILQDIEPELRELGALSGGELYQMQLADRLNEPVLTQWDAWGNRIDHIEVTPLWKRAEKLAAEFGVVAAAYEGKNGRFSRIDQFTRAYLFHPFHRRVHLPPRHDRWCSPYLAQIWQSGAHRPRCAASYQPRSSPVLDQRPMDDRIDWRF